MPARSSVLLHAPLAASLLATLIATAPSPGTPPAPIGVATQSTDGTIILQLRTPSDSGIIGDVLIRYRPGDPDYAEVGPILRGGFVPVRPFGE